MTDFPDILRVLCAYKNINNSELSVKLGISKQAVHSKIARDSFTLRDISKYADILGYTVELRFIDRESGQVIKG